MTRAPVYNRLQFDFFCVQKYCEGHHLHVLGHPVHHGHHLGDLVKILTADKHNRARVRGAEWSSSPEEFLTDGAVLRELKLSEGYVVRPSEIQDQTETSLQHIGASGPGEEPTNELQPPPVVLGARGR